MATYSERRRRNLYGAKIAIVAGIIVAVIGLYFIFGISSDTNKKNAECTEQVTGVITDSVPSGSIYSTTIEYTPGYSPMTITVDTKEQYTPGTEITVNYHPTSFTRTYIEGISSTGKDDIASGIKMILAGAVLAAAGYFLEKMKGKAKSAESDN